MSRFALDVQDLVKVYSSRRGNPVRAVDGMTFAVEPGEIFGLLGPNGAGKSTMLRMLTTLTRPTSGSAQILGFDLVKKPLEVRRRISSVIQETAAELLLSVWDNLMTFARFHGIARQVANARANEAMDRFQLRPLAEIMNEAEELCDDILIMNQGREVARGDLNTLKLLSQGVYDISLTFDSIPQNIEQELAALEPLRSLVNHNSIEVTVKAKEGSVLDTVTALARDRRVLRVEVNGASLEDVFVELMQGRQS